MDEFWREFLPDLTAREREVFDLIGQGLKNTEIAAELGIALATTRTYAKHIHDKLYIAGRSNLAIAAYKISTEEEGNGISKRIRRGPAGGHAGARLLSVG